MVGRPSQCRGAGSLNGDGPHRPPSSGQRRRRLVRRHPLHRLRDVPGDRPGAVRRRRRVLASSTAQPDGRAATSTPGWPPRPARPRRSARSSRQRRPGRLYPREIEPGRGVRPAATARRTPSARRPGWPCARRATCSSTRPASPRRWPGRSPPMGGIAHVLLTHRDDVADAGRWADRFGARMWIHHDDRVGRPGRHRPDRGRWATPRSSPGWSPFPTPGHTKGSVLFLLDERYLFTGDSLAWSHERQDLTAFRERLLVVVVGPGRLARPPGRQRPPLRAGSCPATAPGSPATPMTCIGTWSPWSGAWAGADGGGRPSRRPEVGQRDIPPDGVEVERLPACRRGRRRARSRSGCSSIW